MPQTVSEAVLVQEGTTVITLDKVLHKKIESINSDNVSGITVVRTGNDVDITHSNNVDPIQETKPLQISYDNHGHITSSLPMGKLIVTANGQQVLESNGSTDQQLNFGDDFQKNEQNNITLRWDNHGNT